MFINDPFQVFGRHKAFAFASGLIAALFLSVGALQAQEVGKTAFSLGVSTVGLTGEVAYRLNDNWRVRGVLSGAPSYRSGEAVAGISYDTSASLRGVTLLADRALWGSNFYLSFGAFISGTEATGTATGTFQIGGNTYTTTLNAEAKFENAVAPMIALGYDWNLGKNWVFTSSVGYIYTGGLDISLNGSGVLPGDLILEKLEAQAEIGDGYPFVEIGFRYVF